MGDDAPCIIAGIILPGVGSDLCGLVKDFVEAFEDVVKFLEDIGTAVACGMEDAAKYLGLGDGCHKVSAQDTIWRDFFSTAQL